MKNEIHTLEKTFVGKRAKEKMCHWIVSHSLGEGGLWHNNLNERKGGIIVSKKIYFPVVSLLSCLGLVWLEQTALAASAVHTNIIHITVHSSVVGMNKERAISPSKSSNFSAPSSHTRHPSVYPAPSLSPVSPLGASKQIQPFHLQPRFNLWGFTGDSTLAEGEFLVPLYGDHTRAFYLNVEGNYVKNNSSWMSGAGFGYRQIVNNRIWGGYALADYVSTSNNGFWVINPGLEMLGKVWDININGYIPLENKKKLGKAGFAGTDFGDFSNVQPIGHIRKDLYIQQYEEPGRGLDFEVGRVIPHFENATLYLGAYHFDTSDSGSINGIETRLTYDLNKYSGLELENNYDNKKHNQFIIGIRFNLGNYSEEEKEAFGIATRLMDPIEHDNAVLMSSGLTPVVTFVEQGQKIEVFNAWYFRELQGEENDIGPQQGSGTAEDPFIGFTPANYAAIDPNIAATKPIMYFAPGNYSFQGFDSRAIAYRFNLPNGWGMYGLTDDFKAPAMGIERAKFSGSGLDMVYAAGAGGEATTLNSIQIINDKGGTTEDEARNNAALYIENAGNIILQNANIENSFTNPSGNAFVFGIVAKNSVLNFAKLDSQTEGENNVTVHGIAQTANPFTIRITDRVYGLYATDNSAINFNGGINTISSTAEVTAPLDGYSEGYGIYVNNTSINFNDGTNTILGISTGRGASSSAYGYLRDYGIYIINHAAIYFYGGTNIIEGTGSLANLIGRGAQIRDYGIFADIDTKIKFANSIPDPNDIQIGAFGPASISGVITTENYGIYAVGSASLEDNEGNPITSSSIDNYVKFSTNYRNVAALYWGKSTPVEKLWP